MTEAPNAYLRELLDVADSRGLALVGLDATRYTFIDSTGTRLSVEGYEVPQWLATHLPELPAPEAAPPERVGDSPYYTRR